MKDFVKQGKEDMHDFVIKAIDDLLAILSSAIEFPKNKNGEILEHKLFAVVQSREQVYKSACGLMDLINLNDSDNQSYKDKIIEGLKTTWHELTVITTRNIGDITSIEYGGAEEFEDVRKLGRTNITDDFLSTISKAKELSAVVAYQILDRIALLENPDEVNEEIIKNNHASNIIEKFVENG